jgi:glutamate 5-kinase
MTSDRGRAAPRAEHLATLNGPGRVVVKIGSAVLTDDHGHLDPKVLRRLAAEIAPLAGAGAPAKRWPFVVSSGAIAIGMAVLGLAQRPRTMAGLQSAAAVGQSKLVEAWSQAFRRYEIPVAQILLTHADLADRKRFLNARRALGELERRRALAVINENDTVSFEEIAFGDNDELAAHATNLVDAQLLVMLSTAPGILDGKNERIPETEATDPRLDDVARPGTSKYGKGGMLSKLRAARIACARGAHVAILPGKTPQVLDAFLSGEDVGTLLVPSGVKKSLKSRAHWIAHTLRPCGAVAVDPGAAEALMRKGKSLLPTGVVGVSGTFAEGEAVDIVHAGAPERPFARGLIRYSAAQMRQIIGGSSASISKTLGFSSGDAVVHRDDLVLLEV